MVFARGGSAWTAAASLLNAHIATFEIKSVERLNGSLGVLNEDELHETESAGVARVRITHDGCILHFSVFAKNFSEVLLFHFLSEASDKKVGAFIVLLATGVGLSVTRKESVCVPGNRCLNALTGSHHRVGVHRAKHCGCEPRWCHGRGEANGIAHAARIDRGCRRLL